MTRTLETMQRDLEKAEGVLEDRRAAALFAREAYQRTWAAFVATSCEVANLRLEIKGRLRNVDQSQSQHTLPTF
jgi:hypothetical protein